MKEGGMIRMLILMGGYLTRYGGFFLRVVKEGVYLTHVDAKERWMLSMEVCGRRGGRSDITNSPRTTPQSMNERNDCLRGPHSRSKWLNKDTDAKPASNPWD
jgi:hypothetical protein